MTSSPPPPDATDTAHSVGTQPPALTVPRRACDSHLHIYDDAFPPARPGDPILASATVRDYQRLQQRLGVERAVVVTPGVYRTDNRVTLDAIARLGPGNARGVAVLHPDVADATLDALHAGGVRGIRFTLFNPATAVTSFDMIEPLAARVQRLGWHLQLHVMPAQIVAHAALLERLPGTLVFDHLARLVSADGADPRALEIVGNLLARDRTWIKFSAPSLGGTRPDYAAALPVAHTLLRAAPHRVVWGSDWPHPTEALDGKPDDAALLDLLTRWVPEAAQRERVLVDNPAELYGFGT